MKPMRNVTLASLAIAAMLAAGCNSQDRTTTDGTAGTAGTSGRAENNVSSADRDFVHDVATMNATEIDLSRMATERAASPDVKQFAQKLVDDHTAAGQKLSGIATQNSIPMPTDMNDARDTRSDLAQEQGAKFDKDYIDAIVDAHQDMVDKLESRIDRDTLSKYKTTADQQVTGDKAKVEVKAQTVLPEKSDDVITQRVNQWAADVYPETYAHLQQAKALQKTMK
jgi:putative membrane protein